MKSINKPKHKEHKYRLKHIKFIKPIDFPDLTFWDVVESIKITSYGIPLYEWDNNYLPPITEQVI